MYDIFLDFTNQLFWDGYAEQLAKENPEKFYYELKDFLKTYEN
ncbi:MAG: hypothetical protein WBP45_11030 [Daejeonella sp.]